MHRFLQNNDLFSLLQTKEGFKFQAICRSNTQNLGELWPRIDQTTVDTVFRIYLYHTYIHVTSSVRAWIYLKIWYVFFSLDLEKLQSLIQFCIKSSKSLTIKSTNDSHNSTYSKNIYITLINDIIFSQTHEFL